MADNNHYRVMYSDSVKRLSGFQQSAMLIDFAMKQAKTGKAEFFDTIAPSDSATLTDASLTPIEADYFRGYLAGTQNLTNFEKVFTPHNAVNKGRVLLTPFRNDFGHHFRDLDEVKEGAHDRSIVMTEAMTRISVNRDVKILDALWAANTSQGENEGTVANVAFAGGTINEADGVFDLATITQINAYFDGQYHAQGKRKICIISPTAKQSLIDTSGNTITSKDFVDSGEYFKTGRLPNVYGVSFVVHPLIDGYKGAYDDCFVAFCEGSFVYNQFSALETGLDRSIEMRNQWILYICEFINAVRIDDKAILQGTLGTP